MSSSFRGTKRKLETTDFANEPALRQSNIQSNELITEQPNDLPVHQTSNNQSSNNRSTNQTVNKSINQSQTASQSMITALPGPLFAYLCRYLSLKEKCFLLTTLSHSIKQSIDRSIKELCGSSVDQSTNCFASDTLVIDASNPDIKQKLKYSQSVRSIDVTLDRSDGINDEVSDLLIDHLTPIFFDWLAYNDHPVDQLTGFNRSIVRCLSITEKTNKNPIRLFIHQLIEAVTLVKDMYGHPTIRRSAGHSNNESSSQSSSQVIQSEEISADPSDAKSDEQAINCTSIQISRLEHLTINIVNSKAHNVDQTDEDDQDDDKHFFVLSDFDQLLIHTSLLSITLRTPVCSFVRETYIQFIDALPASLTSITMSHSFVHFDDWPHDHWINKLSNNTFLPNIRHLMLGETGRLSGSLDTGNWLATSIDQSNDQSTQFRPWETLPLSIVDNSLLTTSTASLASLQTLILHITSQGFDLFRSLDASSMPVLENVTMTTGLSRTVPIDLEPLLEFLALRPMKKLAFELSSSDYGQWRPLNNHAVNLISRMSALEMLVITMPTTSFRARSVGLVSNDTSAVIAPGSWPHLSLLRICNMTLNADQFGSFVRGAPALSDVLIGGFQQHPSGFPVQALSLVGKHCPLVKKVNFFCMTVDSRPLPRDRITEWFQDCPPFRHLHQLLLGSNPIHNASLHLIFSLMREAPLKSLTLAINNSDPKFRAIVLRSLPLIDDVDAEFTINTPELRSRTMANGTKFWFFKSENSELEGDHTQDFMQFNEERDENGKTGRECFYEKLYESLTPEEKRRIDAWENEGNYDIDNYHELRSW